MHAVALNHCSVSTGVSICVLAVPLRGVFCCRIEAYFFYSAILAPYDKTSNVLKEEDCCRARIPNWYCCTRASYLVVCREANGVTSVYIVLLFEYTVFTFFLRRGKSPRALLERHKLSHTTNRDVLWSGHSTVYTHSVHRALKSKHGSGHVLQSWCW